MRLRVPLLFVHLIFSLTVFAQEPALSASAEAAFQRSFAAAVNATNPYSARREALRTYEKEVAETAFTIEQKAKLLAAKCTLVAETDFYAALKYFLSDIKAPLTLPTANALPKEVNELVKRSSRQVIADFQSRQNGQTVPTLEQRIPPGVGWRQIVLGSGAAKPPVAGGKTPGTPETPFYGNVVDMNPRSPGYIRGSWNVRLRLPGNQPVRETTWIFDIDGVASVRVDARTSSPETLRYWMSGPYRVLFDYAGGRVDLTLSGLQLVGSIKGSSRVGISVSAQKAPELDYERWGDAAKEGKNLELAEQYFDRAIAARGMAQLYAKRARVRYELGRPNDAIADLDRAVIIDNRFATAYYNRAVTYAALGDLQKALSDAAKAVSLGGKDIAEYYHLRGQIYRRLGNRDAAISDFRSTLRLNPKHPKAKQDLLKYGVTP